MSKIFITGAGSWGTAVAVMLANNGNKVLLWTNEDEKGKLLQKDRENKQLLPGIKFPDGLEVTLDLRRAAECEIVAIVVPSSAVREVSKRLKGIVNSEQIIVNLAKGIEEGTLLRMSEVIGQELSNIPFAALLGPSHAEEVGRGMPTTVTVSSKSREVAERVQNVFMNPLFRIYTTPDLVGVELGSSLKNVIALSAGVCDGMEFGDNTKAALMTRGLTEMARLGVAMGGKPQTFAGLSGVGDLIVTCTSMHSRNRRAGILIGQGKSIDEALKEVGMVVEGYKATKAAYELSKKYNVEMPITTEAYHILYEGKDCKQGIYDLMTREKRNEVEDIWLDGAQW